jgi:hypothetical protein
MGREPNSAPTGSALAGSDPTELRAEDDAWGAFVLVGVGALLVEQAVGPIVTTTPNETATTTLLRRLDDRSMDYLL